MKKLVFSFILCLALSLSAFTQYHRQESSLFFPDIDEYKTLKCDFHIHTAFSDGQVWPDYRVTEAIMDGLDVIAITDHIEYTPHEEYIKGDFNSSFEIAKQEGEKYGILVIKGAEITRSMPPGHLNAIFIKDANALDVENVEDAVEEAYNQGAFIFWNHPCWKAQQPDTVKWFDIHTKLFEKGFIHGIEVVNFSDFCPEAWQWALEKDLCILSNSDIHSTTAMSKFVQHRPITLVFAKDISEKSVRDALDKKRTILFYNETLYGTKELLSKLLESSLVINKRYDKEQNIVIFDISNLSSAPVIMYRHKDLPPRSVPGKLQIPAKSNIHFHVDLNKVESKSVWFTIGNYIYDVDKNLEFELKLK